METDGVRVAGWPWVLNQTRSHIHALISLLFESLPVFLYVLNAHDDFEMELNSLIILVGDESQNE